MKMRVITNQNGFSLMEMIIVVVIMGVLAAAAFYSFRVPRERAACSDIYSAFQSAKMKAIATGYNAYVDFDMDGGSVSNGYYTVWLDTDDDAASFGETSNAQGNNEFAESGFSMSDTYGGVPAVALPNGIKFGGKASLGQGTMGNYGPTWETIPDDGVSATGGGNRFKFKSSGIASAYGSVYLWDSKDSKGAGCAVIVTSTGMIRRWNWDGTVWN